MKQIALAKMEVANLIQAALLFLEVMIENILVDRTVGLRAFLIFLPYDVFFFGLEFFLFSLENADLLFDPAKARKVFGDVLHAVEEDSLVRDLLVTFDEQATAFEVASKSVNVKTAVRAFKYGFIRRNSRVVVLFIVFGKGKIPRFQRPFPRSRPPAVRAHMREPELIYEAVHLFPKDLISLLAE